MLGEVLGEVWGQVGLEVAPLLPPAHLNRGPGSALRSLRLAGEAEPLLNVVTGFTAKCRATCVAQVLGGSAQGPAGSVPLLPH